MRSYFAENGVTNLSTKNKDNIIVYDINNKSVYLAQAKEGEYSIEDNSVRSKFHIDDAKYANVFGVNGEPFVINDKPICPEEMFSGKMIISTGGNELSRFVYNVRNGKINESLSYLNSLHDNDNNVLASQMANLISTSLFVNEEGVSSNYKVVNYDNKYIINEGDTTYIDNVILSENVTKITSTTFPANTGIKNIIIPSTVTDIDANAFNNLISSDGNDDLAVAFLCDKNLPTMDLINSYFVEKGVAVTSASSVTEAMRTGKLAYVSSINRYVSVDTEEKLIEAINASQPGDCIIVNENIILTTSITIRSEVMLLIATKAQDTGYQPSGFNYNGKEGDAEAEQAYATLTLSGEGKIQIDPKGKLLVNSISGQPIAGDYDQDLRGSYGQIVLQDTTTQIIVENNGLLDNFGKITGEGSVICKPNGEVRDLYIVRSWRGGSQAASIFGKVYPMNEYDMHNIEVETTIESGGKLVGNVKMFASGKYWYTLFPQVDNTNGLIRLSEGAKLVKTYDNTTSEGFEFGKENYEISGGATFSSSTLPVAGATLSTKDYLYPIDGDISFDLLSGTYNVDKDVNGFKFMPGATLSLESGATMNITSSSSLAFYNGDYVDPFTGGRLSDTAYPFGRGNASMFLKDGSSFSSSGSVAGIITVEDTTAADVACKISGTEVETLEANGYRNGIKSIDHKAVYHDSNKTKVYFSSEVNEYKISAWKTADEAISEFDSSEIFNDLDDTTYEEGTEKYKEAVGLVEKYQLMISSNIETVVAAAEAKTTDIIKIENRINPLFTVDGTPEKDFDTALEAVKDGGIIQLNRDYEYDAGIIQISSEHNFTLDLNGHTLRLEENLKNSGTLNIINGTIISKYYLPGDPQSTIVNYGNLSIDNCTVTRIVDSCQTYNIYNKDGVIKNISNTTLNYVGINSTIGGIYNAGTIDSRINSISGCQIIASRYGIRNNSSKNGIKFITDTTIIVTIAENLPLDNPCISINSNLETSCEITNVTLFNNAYPAIELSGTHNVSKLSGVLRGNSSKGVIVVSNNPVFIMKDIYLKNEKEGYQENVLYTDNSSFYVKEYFEFEDNYQLSANPLKSGMYEGFYSTCFGYSIAYVSTIYDEASKTPKYNNKTDTYFGHLYKKEIYNNATYVVLPKFNKDSLNYHYTFDGWMDINGKKITNEDIGRINKSWTLFATFTLTEQNSEKPIFVDQLVLSNSYPRYGVFCDTLEEAISKANILTIAIYLFDNIETEGVKINAYSNFNLYLQGHTITFVGDCEYGFDIVDIHRKNNIEGGDGGKIIVNSESYLSIFKFGSYSATLSITININNISLEKKDTCNDNCKFIYATSNSVTMNFNCTTSSLIEKDGSSKDMNKKYSIKGGASPLEI